jgi:phosphoglycerate dehydrogenase-like enzyme
MVLGAYKNKMTLGYMGVGTIPKRTWKLLGKLKFGILAWPKVKTKKFHVVGTHDMESWVGHVAKT